MVYKWRHTLGVDIESDFIGTRGFLTDTYIALVIAYNRTGWNFVQLHVLAEAGKHWGNCLLIPGISSDCSYL